MANNSCLVYPQIPGKDGKLEDSKMYKEMLKIVKDRPKVNWLYCKYIASNVADIMDQAGYKRNNQGEFKAEDVLKYLDYEDIGKEIASLSDKEKQLGAVDVNGNRIDYTNAKEALEKADAFNDRHKGLVATVYQHGDIFNIHVSEKNSRTHMQPTDIKERLAIWDVYKQVFSSIGIDIENLPPELNSTFNANNINIVQRLKGLQLMSFNHLYKTDAMILLHMDSNSPQVQRCISAFGSIEATAQAVDDINHGATNYSATQIRLAMNAIAQCQKMQNLDLTDLQNQVSSMSFNVQVSSPEADIKDTLHKLKKQFNIDINEIHLIGKDIKTLSRATAEAALQIQRQIREVENTKGDMQEGKRLETLLNQLLSELNNKKYYAGILNFLAEAQTVQADIDNMIINTPQSGTEMERAIQRAKNIMKIKSYRDQYYDVISALADESIIIDESIGQTDIDNLRRVAKDFKEFFDKKDRLIRILAEDNMQKLLMEIIGPTAPDGQAIANIVKMAQTDSTIFDYLYSVGRASNPMIAAMGSIIRNAQNERNAVMNEVSLRIRRATDKLYKSGEKDTSFMYEDEEHLISDIDWNSYGAARNAEINNLKRQGLQGFDFRMALRDWEEANTEDRVVDRKTGRTERVPNSQYRKPFPALTHAQLEYYNEMMQIKGEIGSYLPAYAQKQYLAPQVRRDSILDAKNAQDVWKMVKDKAKNLYTVREDDTNYASKGVIDGMEYEESPGAFDNTPLRQIPIFYVNKVEAGELLKDFSTGLQHLAGTAINYDAMNNVAATVEFMGDFIKDRPVKDAKNRTEVVGNFFFRACKNLYNRCVSANTNKIVEGFIAQHVYGQTIDTSLLGSKGTKLIQNIIGYTSFKGLSSNWLGWANNYLVGEFQMLIEAGCGEFYNLKDYGMAHLKLFGNSGVKGEIMELLTNNMNSKGTLFREMFDPTNDDFAEKSKERYYPSMFRQLVSKDLSFIGYASGEYLIHYVNMYAILNHEKVKDANGNIISLYDAFEVTNKQDGNSELKVKQGVTKLNGEQITPEWLNDIRNKIRYCNQSCHGAMNVEDKGIVQQKIWGRAIMNFRQWAVEHYSRRFRWQHYDASLRGLKYADGTSMADREGYWVSLWKANAEEARTEEGKKFLLRYSKAMGLFMRDLFTATVRAQCQWSNLSPMQRNNVRRVAAEMRTFIALIIAGFALGEPEEHKREAWRRFFIYQTKRLKVDLGSGIPTPGMLSNALTMFQSPMAGLNTMESFLYTFRGIENGDITKEIKTGPHKGENRYWRIWSRYNLPFIKHYEQWKNFEEDDRLFQVFDNATPEH